MNIKYKDINIDVDFEINDNITFIGGNSGSGKTYLFNYLKDVIPMYAKESLPDGVHSNMDLTMFRFFTVGDEEKLLKTLLSGNIYIYFIDRGELILNKQMINLINKAKGTFIFFSRHIPGIYYRSSSYTRLYTCKKGSIYYFRNKEKKYNNINSIEMSVAELRKYWGMKS